MADRKITELTNITGANLADGDEFVVVDASADETKALTFAELKAGLDTSTGFVRISGDTMTGTLGVPEIDQGKITRYEDSQTTISRSASNPSTQWVKLVTVDNPGLLKLVYRAGHTSAEERGEIELIHTYTGSNLHLTVNRQTYNALVQTVRVTQVSGHGTDYEIWVLMKNESTQPADPYISAQVYLAMSETKTSPARLTYNMSTGTPGTAVTEVALGTDANTDQRNTKAFTGFQRNYRGGIFNEAAYDTDFRVESVGDTHMLFVDGSANAVGVGTANPNAALQVNDGPVMTSGWSRTMQLHATYPMIVMRSQSKYAAISHDSGSTNPLTFWVDSSSDDIAPNAVPAFKLGRATGSTVFNDSGADVDFRIESVPNAHTFTIQGNTGYIGLGEPNPASNLHVSGSGSQGWLYLNNTHATADHVIYFRRQNSSKAYLGLLSTDQYWLNGSAASKLVIQGKDATEVVVNESDFDVDFRVESDSQNAALFVDGGWGNVGIRTSAPDTTKAFHVQGDVLFKDSTPVFDIVATNNSSGARIGQINLKTEPARGSHIALTDTDGRMYGIKRDYGSGGDIRVAKLFVHDGTTEYDVMNMDDDYTELAINPDRKDADFRVASDTETHAIFLDAGFNSGKGGVGIAKDSPQALLHVGGAGDSAKIGRVTSTIEGGGAANHNWYKILDVDYRSTSSFAQIACHVQIVAAGGTSGEDAHMEFHLFKKQQGTTDKWTLKPFRKHGMDLAYKWDSSGGDHSGGRLELWIAATGVNYQVFDVFVRDLNPNPANDVVYGSWQFTNTNSETQPSGSTKVLFPLTGHQTRYHQGGLGNSEFVVNGDAEDVDFRVASDSNNHALFVDASNNSVSMGASNGLNYGARLMASIGGGSTNAAIACVNTATSGTRRQIDFFDGSSTSRKGSIETNGTSTTFNTTSDRRLKTDIQPISDGTEKLMQMQPVKHKWKADPDADAVHGFIAQDMQQIVAEAVSGEDGGDEMMSMDYGRITPVIVAALQDAHKKIEALEARLAELEV